MCQKQFENLQIAFAKACDHGLMDHEIPHRTYNYYWYYDELTRPSGDEYAGGSSSSERPSVLLGVVLGANRKNINNVLTDLQEKDISLTSTVSTSAASTNETTESNNKTL